MAVQCVVCGAPYGQAILHGRCDACHEAYHEDKWLRDAQCGEALSKRRTCIRCGDYGRAEPESHMCPDCKRQGPIVVTDLRVYDALVREYGPHPWIRLDTDEEAESARLWGGRSKFGTGDAV